MAYGAARGAPYRRPGSTRANTVLLALRLCWSSTPTECSGEKPTRGLAAQIGQCARRTLSRRPRTCGRRSASVAMLERVESDEGYGKTGHDEEDRNPGRNTLQSV